MDPAGKPPARNILIRIGAFCGVVWGLSNGVIGHVDEAMNCTEDGACMPKAEAVSAADVLLPIVYGALGGMLLGLVVWMFLKWLLATR